MHVSERWRKDTVLSLAWSTITSNTSIGSDMELRAKACVGQRRILCGLWWGPNMTGTSPYS